MLFSSTYSPDQLMPKPTPAFMPDRASAVPIFEQICVSFRARIRSGALETGARLPATRALAQDLGVARATVVTAYEQLVAEGYLASRRGSGYTVCAMGEVELSPGARRSAAGGRPA